MKKMFQKSLLAAAVLAGTTAFAADVGQSNLMFPYITTSATGFTFITITNRLANLVNPDMAAGNGAIGVPMHFAYGVKATSAANSTACIHADGMASTTANDVLQFEVADKVNMAAINGDTTSTYYPYTINDRHGFLIVDADPAWYGAPATTRLYGEAVVIDTLSGLTTAYSAKGLNTTTSGVGNGNYTINNVGVAGGPEVATAGAGGVLVSAVGNHGVNPVTWLADSVATSSWFVVPLGTQNEMTPSGGGGLTAGYNMFSDLYVQSGAYDVNEAFHSGATRTDVRCVGVINRGLMLSEMSALNTKKGGTANLVTFNVTTAGGVTQDGAPAGGTAQTPHKSLVYKIQNSSALGTAKTTVHREGTL